MRMHAAAFLNIPIYTIYRFSSLTVKEGSHPRPFKCFADAYPVAKYYWQSDEGNSSTTSGATLDFRHAIRRDMVRKKKPRKKQRSCVHACIRTC